MAILRSFVVVTVESAEHYLRVRLAHKWLKSFSRKASEHIDVPQPVPDRVDMQASATSDRSARSDADLIEEVMYCGISDMRKHLQKTVDALPPETAPMDRIMVAVEAHLRHELELCDYTTASIRNSGQIPKRLSTRQKKEEAAYGRIWRSLFADAIADGQVNPELDARLARLLVMGALNWAAE